MSAPFVVNVGESSASAHPRAGVTVSFEDQDDATIHHPRNEAAACGASAETPTDDSGEAYAAWDGDFAQTTMPWPLTP